MFLGKPKCALCKKEIQNDEHVYIHMRYPKRKGFTEIKAYLRNEGRFICEDCYANK